MSIEEDLETIKNLTLSLLRLVGPRLKPSKPLTVCAFKDCNGLGRVAEIEYLSGAWEDSIRRSYWPEEGNQSFLVRVGYVVMFPCIQGCLCGLAFMISRSKCWFRLLELVLATQEPQKECKRDLIPLCETWRVARWLHPLWGSENVQNTKRHTERRERLCFVHAKCDSERVDFHSYLIYELC